MEYLRESELQGNDAQNADNGGLKTFRKTSSGVIRKRAVGSCLQRHDPSGFVESHQKQQAATQQKVVQ